MTRYRNIRWGGDFAGGPLIVWEQSMNLLAIYSHKVWSSTAFFQLLASLLSFLLFSFRSNRGYFTRVKNEIEIYTESDGFITLTDATLSDPYHGFRIFPCEITRIPNMIHVRTYWPTTSHSLSALSSWKVPFHNKHSIQQTDYRYISETKTTHYWSPKWIWDTVVKLPL